MLNNKHAMRGRHFYQFLTHFLSDSEVTRGKIFGVVPTNYDPISDVGPINAKYTHKKSSRVLRLLTDENMFEKNKT